MGVAKAILKVIMKAAKNLVNAILSPVNDLVASIFPSFANLINQFNTFLNNYIGTSLGWFSHLLPPITRTIIIFWLEFLIVYYGAIWTYHGISQLYRLIQKLKFW